jgi:hypothetical protein
MGRIMYFLREATVFRIFIRETCKRLIYHNNGAFGLANKFYRRVSEEKFLSFGHFHCSNNDCIKPIATYQADFKAFGELSMQSNTLRPRPGRVRSEIAVLDLPKPN